jgi:hypothetical protein
MKLLRNAALTMANLACLGTLAWAAPRVAIVTPLGGEVKLAGASLNMPKIAEEGQHLILGENGQVRIQLLGSSKEKILQGKADYTISKARLESEGVALSRGKVAVAREVGNISRSAAAVSRPSIYHPVGLTFAWPPMLNGQQWVAQVQTPASDLELSENDAVAVTITDLSDPGAAVLQATIEKPVTTLAFTGSSLAVGHRYRLHVQRDLGEHMYSRSFRILSPEEQDALSDTERILRVEALDSNELPALLRLASLYQSFDQTDKVAEVLLEAVNNPQYQELDPVVQQQLLKALNDARYGVDLPRYTPG